MSDDSALCPILIWNVTAQRSCESSISEPFSILSVVVVAASLALGILRGLLVLPWTVASSLGLISIIIRSVPLLLSRFLEDAKVTPRRSVWTIHGKQYDLSSWVQDHPGGQWAINLGRNRDCTGMFESYHMFADRAKLEKILARFEIRGKTARDHTPDQPAGADVGGNHTGLVFNDEFHEDVKELVRSHFKGKSHKMKTWVGCSIAALLCAKVYLAYLFLKGSAIAVVLLPTISFILAMNLGHDGSHFAVSKHPWLNTLLTYTASDLHFGPTCWYLQHVVQHHIYTNDEDDVDLYHFLPVCRASKLTSWVPQFRLQLLGLLFVLPTTAGHLLYVVPMDLLSGVKDAITGTKRYSQCQNLEDFVGRHWRSISFDFVPPVGFTLLSMYMQGYVEGLRRIFIAYGIASYLFIIVTQGAHLQRECMVGKEDQFRSWAKRQAASSVNFCPDSYVWLLFTGGLNLQGLHHVIPGVGSSHLIDLYPEYKKICTKHGIELKETTSLYSFFLGFLGWIQELAPQG